MLQYKMKGLKTLKNVCFYKTFPSFNIFNIEVRYAQDENFFQ